MSDHLQATRLVHRLAALLVCLVWPLIWVGGMVTTYDAGMSVPDWPGTYGYNLFLYPYRTWLFGPFDIFVEHGHRLLGSVVGLVAIALMVAAWRRERRLWVIFLSFAVLVAVIAQGLLGGMRVVLGDRTLAMTHGCFGPAFFAMCTAMAVVTSRWWWNNPWESASDRDDPNAPNQDRPASSKLVAPGKATLVIAVLMVLLSFGQLVLGAQLRHAAPTTSASSFALLTSLHVVGAFSLGLFTVIAWWLVRRCGDLTLSRPSVSLLGLVTVQILLGVGSWVVNYGFPSFLRWIPGSTAYLVRAKGFLESLIVTGHVATGSLILAVSVFLLVRVLRRRHWAVLSRVATRNAAGDSVGVDPSVLPAKAGGDSRSPEIAPV